MVFGFRHYQKIDYVAKTRTKNRGCGPTEIEYVDRVIVADFVVGLTWL